ncbi:MAG: cytidine/deoxycytidylate deaminase family protein [Methanosarcinales archaeon]|nr:cytidine/deoxycytidylate deaminase family protein [Methanosarcinales archaeon]
MRPTIDEYFMNIAEVVATRSTCLRNQVGAVIVRDKRIVSTGYNGAPRNLEHCLDIGCIREQEKIDSGTRHEMCRAVHAEQNAIIQAALHGISTRDSTIYCTHQPCVLCAKMIINASIVRVVFKQAYPDARALEFFREAGIEVVQRGKGLPNPKPVSPACASEVEPQSQ